MDQRVYLWSKTLDNTLILSNLEYEENPFEIPHIGMCSWQASIPF